MKAPAILMVGLLTAGLNADTLHLKNGDRITGTFVGGDRSTIRFQRDAGGTRNYNLAEIEALYVGTAMPDRPSTGQSERSGSSDRYSQSRRADRAMGTDVLPAGTVITVRTIDRIDSNVAQVGETYRASIDDPVVINGRTVLHAGGDATIRVVRVEQSGTITGREEIGLELTSLQADNRAVEVQSSGAEVAAKSRGQQSAAVIGGTAVVGAIIGAIAGGGKGAAIGAASGAGAGTAIQAIRGQRIQVEPESKLDFTLSRDVYLRR